MIKKFIRGHKTRGAEVIKALIHLGGVNYYKLSGSCPDEIYIIDGNNFRITRRNRYSEYAVLVQECFEEIVLEEIVLEEKKVVTNKQFAKWYFNQAFISEVVQYRRLNNGRIYNQMYNYNEDDDPTPVVEIRFNFGEWLPIEKVDII